MQTERARKMREDARKVKGRDNGYFFPSYFSHRLNGSSLPIVSLNGSASSVWKYKISVQKSTQRNHVQLSILLYPDFE